ncbi:MAG: cupredoxin domain-containing protein [Anaerolineae bacterium]|nr:cupredoxin domain-containing protein [Anaerolineae bacterium]
MKGIFVPLVLMAWLIVLSACVTYGAAAPAENGEIKITMKDYDFSPGVIRVKAGQQVTIVLDNEGKKPHEFMIGRDVMVEGNFTEGFAVDFFAGITPQITGPGMVMGLPGRMEATAPGEQMPGEEQEMGRMTPSEPMTGMEHNMDEMAPGEQMAGTEEPTNQMAEGEPMAGTAEPLGQMSENGQMAGDMTGMEHNMESTAGSFGALQRPSMEAHGGVMIMLDPAIVPADQVTTITFTVPADKVGRWEIGCFQEQGQHYDDGMRGILIVDPA